MRCSRARNSSISSPKTPLVSVTGVSTASGAAPCSGWVDAEDGAVERQGVEVGVEVLTERRQALDHHAQIAHAVRQAHNVAGAVVAKEIDAVHRGIAITPIDVAPG